MTHSELWLTYQLASRAHLPSTTQLIDLEFQNHKLADLEDVLEHVFRQGFVEAKHRPSTWWERKDGQKVKASHLVEELLQQGIGKCQESAIKLVVEDVPTTFWFTYSYIHNPTAHHATQRIKLNEHKLELMAHITNHIFAQGYLAPHLRSLVHWQNPCGKRVDEHVRVAEVLAWGEGISEVKPLRLVIGRHPKPAPHHPHHHCGCSVPGN
ncbi:hypothetical protein BD779DRAFT_1609136 [Infundibulicybe gibba]|nr:hypothetical protein BD779DRAFT_1609136 [Infundibulicybe gibba]